MSLRAVALVSKFALTLFIARFIDLETLGVYGLVAGAAVMFPVVASFGLIRVVCRNAVSQPLHEVTDMLRRYWAIQATVYAIISLIALCAGYYSDRLALTAIVVVIVFLEHINADLFNLLNHLSRPRLANVLTFFRTAGWICIYMVLALAFPALRDLRTLLEFWIGGSFLAIVSFAITARNWPWLQPMSTSGHKAWLLQHFRASPVLYINDIANTVAQYTDRYLISLFMGLELTGVYVLFWSIGNALSNLVDTGVIQVTEPKLINAYARQDGSYWSVYRLIFIETMAVSIVLALVTGVLVHFAIPYLNRPLAAEWVQILWPVLLGFVLRIAYEVQGVVFYSRHKDLLTLFSGLFVIVLSIAANMVLIPPFALYGAASAIIVSYITGIIARHVLIMRYCR
jgi:O-antigen/teichoic acid export membrane protein